MSTTFLPLMVNPRSFILAVFHRFRLLAVKSPLGMAITAGLLAAGHAEGSAQPKPNVPWICTDQQRWDTIQALGNEFIHTPNLDRLVSEGVAFTKAHCVAPICTPSRASFLTGMYPSTVRTDVASVEDPRAGPAGYSVLAVLADGTILCLYEADIVTRMCDDCYIHLARFNLEWIEQQ